MKKSIHNTERTGVRPDWLLGGNPRAIEDQESRGQDQLVNSHDLPVKCIPDRSELQAAGIEFGPAKKSDPLFCRAKLPSGWRKEKTDHSMWSHLIDDDGKVRARIVYKAAFYDRDAFMEVIGETE